jgi:hypothetical protein
MVTFPSLLNPNLWCALSDRYLFRMQVLVIAHYLLREMHITDIYANATTALGLKVTGGKSIIIEGGAPILQERLQPSLQKQVLPLPSLRGDIM